MNILILLDRSGSMEQGRTEHENGLRQFVKDQKGQPGQLTFTLVQFDSQNPCEVIFNKVPIADVDPAKITLQPRGCTPLLDAIGKAVGIICESETVMAIVTDGYENASREWTKSRIKDLIKDKETSGWKFVYLGANVDAFAEAQALGIHMAAAALFCGEDSSFAYSALNLMTDHARSALNKGQTWAAVADSYTFTDEQRKQMIQSKPKDSKE